MPGCRVALVALASVLAALWGGSALAGPDQDLLHEVRAGDNLHLIAGYYYGDARQWERIWQANREQVPDANRIERGAWLRIPDAEAPAESYADFLARMAGSGRELPMLPPLPQAGAPAPGPTKPAARLTPVSAESAAEAAAAGTGGGAAPPLRR